MDFIIFLKNTRKQMIFKVAGATLQNEGCLFFVKIISPSLAFVYVGSGIGEIPAQDARC